MSKGEDSSSTAPSGVRGAREEAGRRYKKMTQYNEKSREENKRTHDVVVARGQCCRVEVVAHLHEVGR